MSRRMPMKALVATIRLAAVHAEAQTPASESLAKCQKIAADAAQRLQRVATKRLTKTYTKAADDLIGKQLPETSPHTATQAVKNLAPFDSATSATSADVKKFKETVMPVCDPAAASLSHRAVTASVSHTADDVLDILWARGLGPRCAALGGEAKIDTVEKWVDCMALSAVEEAKRSVGINVPASGSHHSVQGLADEISEKLNTAPPPAAAPADVGKAIAATAQTKQAAVPSGSRSGFAELVKLAFVTSRGVGSGTFGGPRRWRPDLSGLGRRRGVDGDLQGLALGQHRLRGFAADAFDPAVRHGQRRQDRRRLDRPHGRHARRPVRDG